MSIRKASVQDVREIQRLVNTYAKKYQIIPRPLSDLYENLRDFFIFEVKGKVSGVCALHVHWEDLAEVRSLVVETKYRGKGVGKALIKRALREARSLGIKSVFALTYMPEYFNALGFKTIDKALLPHKIWADCLRCTKFPDCDESAVMTSVER